MSYELRRKPNHILELVAAAEAELVERERTDLVRSLGRRHQVPGFRRGKAPLRIVEARFADEIREQLGDRLRSVLWEEVLDQEDSLEPLTEPVLREQGFSPDGGYSFTAELEVRPRYQLPELADQTLPEVSLEVDETEVEAELATLQKEQATWEPADDDSGRDGLLVEADLHGTLDGEVEDDERYDEEGARFVIGADEVPKEISQALQGARVGERRSASRRFPDDDPKAERAGRTVTYEIEVRGFKREVLPELDDELARAVGIDDLDQLRQRIADSLRRRKRVERRETWRRHLLDALSAEIELEHLPPSLVKAAVGEELNRFAYSMAMQGVAPDSNDVDWQELATRFEPHARRKVLDELVLEQLASELAIDVPEGDVDAYVRGEAKRLGIPPAEHKANLAKEGKLEALRGAARISATVDELIRRAGGEVD